MSGVILVLAPPECNPQLRIPVIPATSSSAKLPRNPKESWFMATLCDVVGIGCHRGYCIESVLLQMD